MREGCIIDFEVWLEKLAPHEPTRNYHHNRTGEDNADAHLKRQIMGWKVVVAITKGEARLWPVGADSLRRVRWPAAQARAGEDHRRIEALTKSRIPSDSNSHRRTLSARLCFREKFDTLLSHRTTVSGLQEIITASSFCVFPQQRRKNEIRPPGVAWHSNGT